MRRIYLMISLMIAIAPAIGGNIIYPEDLKYSSKITKEGNSLTIRLDIVLDEVHVASQEMLVLTPVIQTKERAGYHLAPAVIAGSKRYKVIERLLAYNNPVFEQKPQVLTKRKNQSSQTISLSYSIPFEEWLYGADLYVYGDASGCVSCGNTTNQDLIASNIVPPVFIPEYEVSYMVPEAEVKERSETFVARINYVVNRYELLPDFKNNATVLREVDAVIRELQSDPDLTITHHTVTGYASPEGNWNSNITLSKNRAGSFMNYLQQKYNWDTANISHEGKGEDWDGLREAVLNAPDVPHRDRVIEIIDNTPDIARRKQALKALEGGKVYAMLLKELYPPLRRNEFKISYIARPFNVSEAREVIRTRPQLLNLNEMFLVANSYPKDSKEFKEVFNIASRMFPNNVVSKVNAAAMELETGPIERAIEQLTGIEIPEAWNNLGVAYAQSGNYESASRCFKRAIEGGNEKAVHNLEQLEKAQDSFYQK
ncbi:DUF3868 domain-containing protein [Bacteroides sp. OttesenSCG-928-J23]|nr:DUF3868 domain-containing protein [Bacteroides sp. OttesenSCG-928-N06]MDL2247282.1 DUF3868 domain-containing protein [Bacteroides sp. OttesenSCG-928-J23]MDL2299388.1 DUF3868 domain-containing protein [Bacteroides sp. OttesenSCG-928-E20]MDL2305057.1 DUF3868 domain-containing protein [Bacteroides sp. OttesenSCG-928-D19]